MVVSALGLVYTAKLEGLLKRSFLKSPEKTAEYWCDVLTRFHGVWEAEGESEGTDVTAASQTASPISAPRRGS